jgi:spore coat protein CotH
VFAGAAREAVFSNPDVIKRVNADFVPVALKAGLVNNPPNDEEGLLYREISRSKPAPQGICVVNSAGKVLNWTLMFDDDKSVLAFFDHARERFAKYPDAKKPVAAEVYQKFPSQKRKDVADSGNVLPVLDRHSQGKLCLAEPPLRKGTVAVRLFGRALDKDGKPVADTVRQENYIEDRFNIPVQTQEKLAKALADAGTGRVALPLEVTRLWVKQAYMGVLDVQPLDNPGRGKGELKKCDFGAQKVASRVALAPGVTIWRVEGESEVFIDDKMANGSPGDMHEVKLKWHGFIEMDGDRMTLLVLSAGGKEKLKFQSARGKEENEVAILPGGHRINMECGVLYGIIGEPVAADEPKQPEKPVAGADVFGHDKVWQFHLALTAAEFAAMQPAPDMLPGGPGGPMPPPKVEPKSGEPKRDVHRSAFGIEFPWAVASLTTDGKTIEKVGLRYKGNATYVMSGRNLKRSLKVDIDRLDHPARFHGLKSLTLNCGVFDPSRSREALAYSIYRAAGVPAPRTAFAEVTLTVPGKYEKEHVGLYTLIESVDKNFLKLHFKNNAGLLMKPERIPGLVYLGEDWARYKDTYLPKREATKDEIKRVIDFTRLVNATPDAQFNTEIASYLDVDAFLKFMAVTAIVANLDSFHGGHNYCLYLHPETNKFHFIPWDLDLALGGFPMLGMPEQMDLSLTKPYPGQSKLAERLMANKEYADKYHHLLKELVPLCFAKEKLLNEIATIEKVVKPLIEKETTAVAARKENAGGPGGTVRFGHPAADLKTFVEKRSESIAAQLAGKSKGFTPARFGPPGGPGKGGPGGGRPNPAVERRQIIETLGPRFLVFRDKVQEELKLSDEQKK